MRNRHSRLGRIFRIPSFALHFNSITSNPNVDNTVSPNSGRPQRLEQRATRQHRTRRILDQNLGFNSKSSFRSCKKVPERVRSSTEQTRLYALPIGRTTLQRNRKGFGYRFTVSNDLRCKGKGTEQAQRSTCNSKQALQNITTREQRWYRHHRACETKESELETRLSIS